MRVARVLMTWIRPYHLSDAEAQAWVRTEVRRLAAIPDVKSVSLTQPGTTARHRRPWDWVCELDLRDGAVGVALVEHSVCAEWLLDLRLLGMHPVVAILEATETVMADAARQSETVSDREPRERAQAAAPRP
jgi:hypothetical protein